MLSLKLMLACSAQCHDMTCCVPESERGPQAYVV
jgi:hypothetical protein